MKREKKFLIYMCVLIGDIYSGLFLMKRGKVTSF